MYADVVKKQNEKESRCIGQLGSLSWNLEGEWGGQQVKRDGDKLWGEDRVKKRTL